MGRIVDIEDIPDGYLLAEDVMNAQGMVLLKQGMILSEKHKTIFKRWGIKKVAVDNPNEQSSDGRDAKEILEEKLKELETEIQVRFQDVLAEPLMDELKDAVHEYRVEKLQAKYGQS